MGAELTAVDLVRPHPNSAPTPTLTLNPDPHQRLCMTLLRFDCCYHKGFGIRTARHGGVLSDATGSGAPSAYPSLAGYVREVYALIAPEVRVRVRVRDRVRVRVRHRVRVTNPNPNQVDWAAFRQYYRWAPGVAPEQPLPDVEMIKASAEQPHGREGVGAA